MTAAQMHLPCPECGTCLKVELPQRAETMTELSHRMEVQKLQDLLTECRNGAQAAAARMAEQMAELRKDCDRVAHELDQAEDCEMRLAAQLRQANERVEEAQARAQRLAEGWDRALDKYEETVKELATERAVNAALRKALGQEVARRERRP